MASNAENVSIRWRHHVTSQSSQHYYHTDIMAHPVEQRAWTRSIRSFERNCAVRNMCKCWWKNQIPCIQKASDKTRPFRLCKETMNGTQQVQWLWNALKYGMIMVRTRYSPFILIESLWPSLTIYVKPPFISRNVSIIRLPILKRVVYIKTTHKEVEICKNCIYCSCSFIFH